MKIEKISIAAHSTVVPPASATFVPAGFVGIRTPAFGLQVWKDYLQQGRDAAGGFCIHRRAEAARAWFSHAAVQEAIWLASSGLYARLEQWNWNADTDHGRKLLQTFDRYLNRMCFRSTPFGTFAAMSHAKLVSAPDAPVFDSGHLSCIPLRRAYSVDSELAFHLTHQAHLAAPHAFRYAVNASAYARGDAIRYTGWRQGKFGSRSYASSEIDRDDQLDVLLFGECTTGRDFADWVGHAERLHQCGPETAAALIDQLIRAKLLLPYPGVDFLVDHPVRRSYEALPQASELETLRQGFGNRLAEVARLNTGQPLSVTDYRAQNTFFGSLLSTEIQTNSCLQVDAFRDVKTAAFNDSELLALTRRVSELYVRFGYRNNGLDKFTASFRARHDQEFVRLIDVLDDEELEAEDFDFNSAPSSPPNCLEQLILRKMIDNGSANHPITLSFSDIFNIQPSDLASGMLDIFAIAEKISAAAGCPPQFELHDLMSSNSVRWLARFAHGDPALEASIRDLTSQIAACDPDLVHVEVGYMPASRFGNVMRRPLLWPYVLDLAERTEHDQSIPVSDLWLGAGAHGLELWSARLNRAVMPHVTSAHNPQHNGNTKLYKFLRAFERQAKWIFDFKPGDLVGNGGRTPRIEYEGVIIRPAFWRFTASEVSDEASLCALLARCEVPHRIKLVSGDNSLVLDRLEQLDLQQLYRSIKQDGQIHLREYFEPAGELEGYSVNHELVIPMLRRDARPVTHTLRQDFQFMQQFQREGSMQRLVAMNNMVYLKLYMAPSRFDAFIEKLNSEFTSAPSTAVLIHEWFFLRYSDPQHHLRLRLRCKHQCAGQLVQQLLDWLQPSINTRVLDRYSFEQYQPEYTRYGGGDAIGFSEVRIPVKTNQSLSFNTSQAFSSNEGQQFRSGLGH